MVGKPGDGHLQGPISTHVLVKYDVSGHIHGNPFYGHIVYGHVHNIIVPQKYSWLKTSKRLVDILPYILATAHTTWQVSLTGKLVDPCS